jgi:hypothetical protein
MRLENGPNWRSSGSGFNGSLVISNASAFVDFSAAFNKPVQVDRAS